MSSSQLRNRPAGVFPEAALKTARERQGMTQEDLAHRLDTYLTQISRYENGTPAIKMWQLPLWAQALGLPVWEILPSEWLAENEELDVIRKLRNLSPQDREHVLAIIDGFVERTETPESNTKSATN